MRKKKQNKQCLKDKINMCAEGVPSGSEAMRCSGISFLKYGRASL